MGLKGGRQRLAGITGGRPPPGGGGLRGGRQRLAGVTVSRPFREQAAVGEAAYERGSRPRREGRGRGGKGQGQGVKGGRRVTHCG